MQRSYHDVQSLISPNMFEKVYNGATAYDFESHSQVGHEAFIEGAPRGRYTATGMAEDVTGHTQRVDQPQDYRTPLRAKVAAIHAARDAVRRMGYSN